MSEIGAFWEAVEHRRSTRKVLPESARPARSAQERRDSIVAMLPVVNMLLTRLSKTRPRTELLQVERKGSSVQRSRAGTGWVATRHYFEATRVKGTSAETHQHVVFLSLRGRLGAGLHVADCVDPEMNGHGVRYHGKLRTYGDVGLNGPWPEQLDVLNNDSNRATMLRLGKQTSPAAFAGIAPDEVWRGLVEIAAFSLPC